MARIDWGENLNLKISMLPESPGCYLMKDKDGTIIYVGKAVNLKNRVRSYFRDTSHTPKVAAMITHIDDFDILLCESNLEALCLECNLIKEHKPYYNILLKDDKHYPYIKLNLHETFPRLRLARRMESDGAKYYGPYIGATAVKQVIETVRDVFPIRSCSLSFPLKKPVRPCINYDMGKCLAPCSGNCSEATYSEMITGVLSFLGGDYEEVLKSLETSMQSCAQKMEYEKAAVFRDKIKDVKGLMERQIAIRTDLSEQDILALSQDGLDAMVQILYVRGGKMLGGDHFALPGEGGEDPGEVLSDILGLPSYPRRIEGYDISNTQGVLSVGSMVVFIDGEPANKEYRQFRIKTVEGANDFASLHEVLTRRFTHGLQEKAEREAQGLPAIGGKFSDLPDLILIDGGPQQVRFARSAILALGVDIPMFGLAERLEISRDEARQLIDGFFETFPKVKDYMERAKQEAREKGYVETLFGRRRYLPDIRSANATVRGFAERNAINAPIQGTAADIIKVAMIRIFNRFKAENIRSKMILQVHDELIVECPEEKAEQVRQLLKEEMEKIIPPPIWRQSMRPRSTAAAPWHR